MRIWRRWRPGGKAMEEMGGQAEAGGADRGVAEALGRRGEAMRAASRGSRSAEAGAEGGGRPFPFSAAVDELGCDRMSS